MDGDASRADLASGPVAAASPGSQEPVSLSHSLTTQPTKRKKSSLFALLQAEQPQRCSNPASELRHFLLKISRNRFNNGKPPVPGNEPPSAGE